jgi:hypothetical protein
MHNGNTWDLPFGEPAELELQSEWGTLTLVPVEAGQQPRLELSRGSAENVAVHVDKIGERVRVALEPQRGFNFFGSWECRATVYVPRDVHAHVQTNAGTVHVSDLVGCELGVKASAGKIQLNNVYGVIHVAADAGSVTSNWRAGWMSRSRRTPAWAQCATTFPRARLRRRDWCFRPKWAPFASTRVMLTDRPGDQPPLRRRLQKARRSQALVRSARTIPS